MNLQDGENEICEMALVSVDSNGGMRDGVIVGGRKKRGKENKIKNKLTYEQCLA